MEKINKGKVIINSLDEFEKRYLPKKIKGSILSDTVEERNLGKIIASQVLKKIKI